MIKKRFFTILIIMIMITVCACGRTSSSETETYSQTAGTTLPSETTMAESSTEPSSETTTPESTTQVTTDPETTEVITEAETDTEQESESEEYLPEDDDSEENNSEEPDISDNNDSRSVDTEGYSIDVNLTYGCVTIYYNGEPIRAMRASVGTSGGCETVAGDFSIGGGSEWMYMEGDVWAQYATRFYGAYLFHSVPYYSRDHGDLEYNDYNLLGSPASLGCVRLSVEDARWIYYNMPYGTPVHTFYDSSSPGPLGKPGGYWIPTDIVELRGWDPTDPVDGNPWPDYYVDITAPDITLNTNDDRSAIYDEVTVIDRYGNDVSNYAEYSDSIDISSAGEYTAYVSVSIGGYYYTETSFNVTITNGPSSDDSDDSEIESTTAAESEDEETADDPENE